MNALKVRIALHFPVGDYTFVSSSLQRKKELGGFYFAILITGTIYLVRYNTSFIW